MNREQIIRAWKDEEYRAGLSEAERSVMPEHPSGIIELSDAQLGAAGGEEAETWRADTWGCCGGTVWFYACGSFKVFSFGCACGERLA
ncbi:MAG TPA: mersacidin/lichenicidin family type 2 lantibiotic [Pyrinomonadaceae bacterium]|jgi:mersacidin/lichenicidin family type 2 lantibiotic